MIIPKADIELAWENRSAITTDTTGTYRNAVEAALQMLDSGQVRVAEPDGNGGWQIDHWLKKTVLLSFRLRNSETIQFGNQLMTSQSWRNETHYGYDKVPLKTAVD